MTRYKNPPAVQTLFVAWMEEAFDYFLWLYDVNSPTKNAFAKFLGLKPELIYDFFSGRSTPTLNELQIIAQAFGSSVYNTIDPDVLPNLKPVRSTWKTSASTINTSGISAIVGLIEFPLPYAENIHSQQTTLEASDQSGMEVLPIEMSQETITPCIPEEDSCVSVVMDAVPVSQDLSARIPTKDDSPLTTGVEGVLSSHGHDTQIPVEPLPAAPIEFPDSILTRWDNYLRLTAVTYAWVKRFSLTPYCAYPGIASLVDAIHIKASSLSIRIAGIPFSQELYAQAVACEQDVRYLNSPNMDVMLVYDALDRLQLFVSEAESRLDYRFCLNPV